MRYASIEDQRALHCVRRMYDNRLFARASGRQERAARNFDVTRIGAPNRVWAGDITYLPTREGWLYLAIVLDLATRNVVGWSIWPTMERALVIDALHAALANRRSDPGLLFHSDRGSQYARSDYRDVLNDYGITASMSGKGECWDNAVVESFFGGLKTELGNPMWKHVETHVRLFSSISRSGTIGSVGIHRSGISPEQHEQSKSKAA